MQSPSVLGVVPARGGSKGVPGKNIRELGGKPLIAHTLEAASRAALLTRTVVSTDSEEISDVCRAFGADVPFLRPPELASDTARVQDAVLHLLDQLEATYTYVLLLQPTAPFRSAEDIDGAIRLATQTGAESVVSFTQEETQHPYYMYELDQDCDPPRVTPMFNYPVGTPRQEFPPVYYRNGAIYLTRTDTLRRDRSFVSPQTVPYLMPEERSVNIDTEEDFQYAEYLLAGSTQAS